MAVRIGGESFLRGLDANRDGNLSSEEAKTAIDGTANGKRDGKIDATEEAVFKAQALDAGVSETAVRKVIDAAIDPRGTASVALPPSPATNKARFAPGWFDLGSMKLLDESEILDGGTIGVLVEDKAHNRLLLHLTAPAHPPVKCTASFFKDGDPNMPGRVPPVVRDGTTISRALAQELAPALEAAVRRAGAYEADAAVKPQSYEQDIARAAERARLAAKPGAPDWMAKTEWSQLRGSGSSGDSNKFVADFIAGPLKIEIVAGARDSDEVLDFSATKPGNRNLFRIRYLQEDDDGNEVASSDWHPVSTAEWQKISDGLQMARVRQHINSKSHVAKDFVAVLDNLSEGRDPP